MKQNRVKKYKGLHFRNRLFSRYGITSTRGLVDVIRHKIKTGNYEYGKKQSCSRSFFLLDLAGRIVYIVFDTRRHMPLTALPLKDFFNRWRVRE